jgi:hypothetical protein
MDDGLASLYEMGSGLLGWLVVIFPYPYRFISLLQKSLKSSEMYLTVP